MNEYKKSEDEFYMTVGDIREKIKNMPDDARVYYQRIEDVYFDKHKWVADKVIPDDFMPDERELDNEYIHAFCCFEYSGDLYITAHY